VRSVLFVYVKNVNAQSVTLVERSVTQRAWESTVSLIYASSVLEMSVTVVFVCKDFITTITKIVTTGA
jgi:hypothetical protein